MGRLEAAAIAVGIFGGGLFAPMVAQAFSQVQGVSEPSFEQVLSEEDLPASGAGFEIAPPISRSGTLLFYNLKTPQGTFPVRGTAQMRKRLAEVQALQQLNKTDWTALAGDGAVEAVKKPLTFLGDLVRRPGTTLSESAERVGEMIDGTVNTLAGKNPPPMEPTRTGESPSETLAAAVVGRDQARREIAVQIGVDPYTTFTPLSDKLDEAAWAYASSNRVVRLASLFIPGSAGAAVTGIVTSADFRKMLVESPAVLNERMRKALEGLEVRDATIRSFLAQPALTPAEKLVLVGALQQLRPLLGIEDQVALVTTADAPSGANYMVLALLMAVDYHQNTAAITALEVVQGVPVGQTSSGALVVFIAGDRVGWELRERAALLELQSELDARKPPEPVEYRIYGLANGALHEALWDRNGFIRERAPVSASLSMSSE